jgi:hypothetical protein
MPSIVRRWVVILLMTVLPSQAAFAAGGLLCAMGADSDHSMSAHYPQPASGHGLEHHDHGPGQHQDGGAPFSLDLHGTCAACAPCCGSLAPPAAPSVGPDLAHDHGADFLPVLVLIRPARPDGLERPPRTI